MPVPIAILLSSLLAVGLASFLFRDRPASRRLFLISLLIVAGLVPLVCLIADIRLQIGVQGLSLPAFSPDSIDRIGLFLVLSGLILVAAQLLLVVRARRRLNRLPAMELPVLEKTLEELAPVAGVTTRVSVRTGFSSCSSSLGGRLILLPPDSTEWQQETLRAVLAHELVHLSRRDDLWLLLARLLMLQFWWLPWLRLLPAWLERSIEESCDDLAAFLIRSERAYLHGVFEAASGKSLAPVGAIRAAGGSVVDRFRRFSAYRDQQIDSRGLYWASLGLLAGFTLVWTVELVPVAAPLPEAVRIVGTTTSEGEGPTLSVRLGEPPVRLSDDATRIERPISEHDPPP